MFPRLKLGQEVLEDSLGGSVFIKGKDMFQHALVVGKTGTGKTVFSLNWFFILCWFKVAKILIEPSGFMARDAYSICGGKAIYCSLKHPVSINPMRQKFDPHTVSSILREAMNQVIEIDTRGANKDMTVKMNVIFDRVVVSCLERNQSSLEAVRDEIAAMRGDNETRDGISARLNFLLNDPRMRTILCGDTTLDIAEFTKSKGTFILDCSGMTTEQLVFVGNLLSQSVKNHLRFSSHDEIHPLALILDEAHNFISPSWTTILKEGRKYGLSCMLASQDLVFFSEQMRRVMLNVGSIVCFRVGHHEAQAIARELHIETEVLQFLEKYHHCFLTSNQRGMAKAPRPPIFRTLEVPTLVAEPTPIYSHKSEPKDFPTPRWFERKPYYSHETTNSEEARAGAP